MMYRCSQCHGSFEIAEGAPRCPDCGSFLVEPQSGSVQPQPSKGHLRGRYTPQWDSGVACPPGMYATGRVGAPATFLKWLAGAGVTMQALGLVRKIIYIALGVSSNPFEGADTSRMSADELELFQKMAAVAEYFDGAVLIIGMIGVAIGVVIYVGACHMQRLDSLGLARLAAVLAIIPCTSPCCMCLSMPVGVWALVVLCDRRVAAEFNSRA